VEFALILPFVCLLIALMLDVGRAFNYWIDTTHLATEGARMAAVDQKLPAEYDSLQEYLRLKANTEELVNGGSGWIEDPLRVCVNAADDDVVGDPVEVTVSATYHWLPIIDLAPMEIHGSATMRREVAAENVEPGCG
jgi:TadE-like protein